jgi:hypothetical protein
MGDGMSGRFDDLTRAMAGPMPRRGALKVLGAAAAASVGAVVLKPFRADAGCKAGEAVCGTSCCAKGLACLDASTGRCSCPSGTVLCGPTCCRGTCTLSTGIGCCCEPGLTPCGINCCRPGVACLDRSRAQCGCPPRYTACGSGSGLTCCPLGTPCGGSGCKSTSDTTLHNYIPCNFSQPCRAKLDPCFSNSDCCPGLTCSCTNEGFAACC